MHTFNFIIIVILFANLQSYYSLNDQKLQNEILENEKMLECSLGKGCWDCVKIEGCTWCLSQNECLPVNKCVFTSYDDCCVIIPNCEGCSQKSECVYCTGAKTGCFSGNEFGPINETCDNWKYMSCPSKSNGMSPLILGIIISIGCAFVLLSFILLGMLIRRLYWHKKAREAEIYFNYSKITCQYCKDGVANIHCYDCKLNLCSHCCESEELHPISVKHRIDELSLDIESIERMSGGKYQSLASLLQNRSYNEPDFDHRTASYGNYVSITGSKR